MPKTPAPDLETLLTIQQVAELENVSPKTIRRRIGAGALPAIRNGRLLRIRPQDLRSYRLRQMLGE